jgi:hypothetical protein
MSHKRLPTFFYTLQEFPGQLSCRSLASAWRQRIVAASRPLVSPWATQSPLVDNAARMMGFAPRRKNKRYPKKDRRKVGLSNFKPEESRWKPQSSPEQRTPLHHELVDLAWRSSPSFDSVALSCLSQRAVEEGWARHMEVTELGLGPLRVTPFGSQLVGVSMPGGDLDMKVSLERVWLPSNRACARM